MQFDLIPLQEFIKNNAKTPTKDTIEDFKIKINNFLSQALKANEEDYQKKEISNFLEKTYDYTTNIRGSIDLAIYVDDIVNVTFEVKSTINKKEFPQSNQDLSSKAFYESVLYFLRERKSKKNNFIKFIIICTAKDFFIIDAREYERLFENDKTIIKHYKNCDEKQGTNTKTQEFYDQLSSYLKTLDKNLKYTHFELRDDLDETTLSYIYQILSPQVLLKEKITQDANALNENFYKELLYILGLKEEGEKSKKIILSDTPNTLSYAIKQAYKDISFDDIFALLITWNNRILFLRLFESMLLSFNHIQKPFLTIEKIPNFAKLSELFFEVLAKKEEQRGVKEFDFIPYLNSSLFDKNTQEQQHKDIRLLDSKPLEIFQNSKLAQEYKDLKSLPLLEYLFAFLRTYDFTTTSKDIQNNQKINHDKLINASVLGNVFEKLNGYKEGSYYTPSFITSYMCKESIQKIVFDKFEQEHSLKANSIDDLRVLIDRNFTLEKQKAYFNTILSIKICDPAVGSGHFLVSALNELIYILYQLGLIKSLLREKLILENDELIIYTNDKGIFNYQKPNFQNDPFHQIQKELFECKKLIIENCLFGVDINPNSCEITKLRLWIELLKYSFYIFENDKNTNTLQILPNIDINIKCGNSLISKIPTNEPLMLQNQESVKLYKQLEDDYYNGLYINKEEHLEKINKIKSNFIKAYINVKHAKEIKDFHKKCEEYAKNYEDFGLNTLPEKYEELKMRIQCQLMNLSLFNVTDLDKEKALKDLEVLKEKYDEIFYGFEWRVEFSKILHSSLSKEEIANNNLSKQKGNFKNLHKDKEGEFLGFDLIIGNPPYISILDLSKIDNSKIYKKFYPEIKGAYDIFILFIIKGLELIKRKGYFCWIIPNKFLISQYAQSTYEMLLKKKFLEKSIDVSNLNVFENASVYPIIIFGHSETEFTKFIALNQDDLKTNNLQIIDCENIWNKFKTFKEYGIKIQSGLAGFQAHSIVEYLSEKKTKNSMQFIVSGSIDRYEIDSDKVRYMNKTYNNPYIKKNNVISEDKWNFWNNEKIIIAGMTKKLESTYCKHPIAMGVGVYAIYDFANINPLVLLGILNSKFMNYVFINMFKDKHLAGNYLSINKNNLESLPMFDLNSKNEKIANELVSLVDEILNLKEQDKNANTKTQEDKINSIVYKLYNLSKEEIKIIEGK
ncbi:class I SAM-dependent DNA methyltransferase [Campylobacter peloridis]|uniref:site-specific DNA-methyltransferase (adenine-specific) n=1 Tax=Campylobacter peloridis TaxID=488546 RepID=A0A5C7DUL8_9BACT|nr:Eco57I restriction-modification methylase domain-containing protein [Campylobacter peloridis]TXE78888.1 class I SAM-dependent DNA methyltransferase [Campylobacter peloridis]